MKKSLNLSEVLLEEYKSFISVCSWFDHLSQPPAFFSQTLVLCTADLISSALVTLLLSPFSPQDMAMQPPAQMEGRCSA